MICLSLSLLVEQEGCVRRAYQNRLVAVSVGYPPGGKNHERPPAESLWTTMLVLDEDRVTNS
jgi:hypothetical protein